jgi:hypothetical protein
LLRSERGGGGRCDAAGEIEWLTVTSVSYAGVAGWVTLRAKSTDPSMCGVDGGVFVEEQTLPMIDSRIRVLSDAEPPFS